MRKTILPIALFCWAWIFLACEKDEEPLIEESQLCLAYVDGTFQAVVLQEVPEYLNGGRDGFIHAIYSTIKYPASAREAGIQGLCIVRYEITENGKVENMIATEDPGGGIGAAAIEALASATEGVSFSPGILNQITGKSQERAKSEVQVAVEITL